MAANLRLEVHGDEEARTQNAPSVLCRDVGGGHHDKGDLLL